MINYTMNKSNKSNDVEKKSTLAKLLATENIEVQENAVSTASFDIKNRILTIPIFKKEHKSKNVYDMLVGHEVAHALWTPADSWANMTDRKEELNDKWSIKMNEVESLILPLLQNLAKDGDKREWIRWPNRTDTLNKQIDDIKLVTRGDF